MSLWSHFISNDELLTMKSVHYFPIYERHFSRFKNLDVTIFEIGVWEGGSLQIWKKYFGPNATIVGIDIDEQCIAAEEDQIHIRIGDQSDTEFLDRLIKEFGVPDIIIDDGSHESRHINATFDHLYPMQLKNSVYLVEDTFFSYREESGFVLKQCESFMERTKKMIDLLHARYLGVNIKENFITSTTHGIHIYDSVVVFEKQGINRRVSVTGSKNLLGSHVDKSKLEGELKDLLFPKNT
jgi:23S rRNA U2552 (ribose-2'-O)-methylase RlmE/FtsJ